MSAEAGRRIRFRVVTPTHTAVYTMPWTDAPVAALGNLPADMLDRAVLRLGDATALPEGAVAVPATVGPPPTDKRGSKNINLTRR